MDRLQCWASQRRAHAGILRMVEPALRVAGRPPHRHGRRERGIRDIFVLPCTSRLQAASAHRALGGGERVVGRTVRTHCDHCRCERIEVRSRPSTRGELARRRARPTGVAQPRVTSRGYLSRRPRTRYPVSTPRFVLGRPNGGWCRRPRQGSRWAAALYRTFRQGAAAHLHFMEAAAAQPYVMWTGRPSCEVRSLALHCLT